ncbi:hypothetical protein PMIN03_012151 [Paraphaeosphaeria minitans]
MTEDCLQGPKNEFLADWKRVDELAGSVIQFFLQSQKGAPLKSLERFAYLVEENYELLVKKRDMFVYRKNMDASTLRLVSRFLLQVFKRSDPKDRTWKINWHFCMVSWFVHSMGSWLIAL